MTVAKRKPREPTPREMLDELWQKTMLRTPHKSPGECSAIFRESIVDELEDKVKSLKQHADHQHASTGVYPDAEVLEFLDSLNLGK